MSDTNISAILAHEVTRLKGVNTELLQTTLDGVKGYEAQIKQLIELNAKEAVKHLETKIELGGQIKSLQLMLDVANATISEQAQQLEEYEHGIDLLGIGFGSTGIRSLRKIKAAKTRSR